MYHNHKQKYRIISCDSTKISKNVPLSSETLQANLSLKIKEMLLKNLIFIIRYFIIFLLCVFFQKGFRVTFLMHLPVLSTQETDFLNAIRSQVLNIFMFRFSWKTYRINSININISFTNAQFQLESLKCLTEV